jgi:hypothetical protein
LIGPNQPFAIVAGVNCRLYSVVTAVMTLILAECGQIRYQLSPMGW